LIGRYLTQGSFARRLVTRAVVVFGAVLVGGQVMRTLPHDQTLIFPIGSVFPEAARFSASWQQPGSSEPSGGVTLGFKEPPPLQIRQHARLPNGDYIVTIVIEQNRLPKGGSGNPETKGETPIPQDVVKTTVERRVTLAGGETLIALATSTSVSE
jgi:hypothetical protein